MKSNNFNNLRATLSLINFICHNLRNSYNVFIEKDDILLPNLPICWQWQQCKTFLLLIIKVNLQLDAIKARIERNNFHNPIFIIFSKIIFIIYDITYTSFPFLQLVEVRTASSIIITMPIWFLACYCILSSNLICFCNNFFHKSRLQGYI